MNDGKIFYVDFLENPFVRIDKNATDGLLRDKNFFLNRIVILGTGWNSLAEF